jgi:ectoine hydroxylase-related dioxygenase (phytanoyl-CoA dioxygenase family)
VPQSLGSAATYEPDQPFECCTCVCVCVCVCVCLRDVTEHARVVCCTDMKGAVMRVVQLAVGALQGVVAALMTADALVCDFACLISDPGAPRQRLHADTTFDSRGSLLTLFIALQDVTAEMGGTLVLPGTASRSGHAALDAMSAMGPEAHQRHERHWLSEQGLRFECESLLWHHVYLYFARKVRHSEVF